MKNKEAIVLIIVSLLSGVLFGQIGIFGLMKIGFLLLLVIGVSGIGLLVGAIKNNPKIIKSSGSVMLFSFGF